MDYFNHAFSEGQAPAAANASGTPVAPAAASPNASAPQSAARTLTISIPKLNMQVIVLALLAIVTIFQTVQLYSLKSKAGALTVKAATGGASSAAPAAAAGSNAALPDMVGGC
ncbi:MAG: hypothetical protein HW383_105 [Candidatus Magasanikbacteria bacterium]|nr:hypothetical protein [Candidatus Magasanikbacteria bacterium]